MSDSLGLKKYVNSKKTVWPIALKDSSFLKSLDSSVGKNVKTVVLHSSIIVAHTERDQIQKGKNNTRYSMY